MTCLDNKAIMFFSAPASKYLPIFNRYRIDSVLMSYWYIRQKKREWERLVDYVNDLGGIIMVDSGAHTFKNDNSGKTDWTNPKNYTAYIEEFVQFCYDNSKNIYCTVNIDMDNWVGVDQVDKWNDKYFKPLDKVTNVIFNVDSIYNRKGIIDRSGYTRFKEYAEEFSYVGINRNTAEHAKKVFALAQKNRVKVHGFAITSLNILKDAPFFSVDSTTWLGGVKYGTTYQYDGKNFRTLDFKHKYVRKLTKLECRKYGIDYESFLADKDPGVTEYNLHSWKHGFEKEFLLHANRKLTTKNVAFYDKRHIL